MNKDFQARNDQFNAAVAQYGWFRILKELTPLDGAVDYIGTKNSKRLDICPSYSCSEHQLWNNKGNFELFDESGAGYCYKCRNRFSPFDIIMEFNKISFADAKRQIENHIGFRVDPNFKPTVIPSKPITPKAPTKSEIAAAKRQRQAMNDLWEQAHHLDKEESLPAARYFAKRGIMHLGHALHNAVKCHTAMPFFIPIPHLNEDRSTEDTNERLKLIHYCQNHPQFVEFVYKNGSPVQANMGNHPCILLLVKTPKGEPRRIHRIYIDQLGNKACFSRDGFEVKRMMPGGHGLAINGCACYIDQPSLVRGVGEGLETVLAVKQVTDMPMDCAINAGMLKNYTPPPGTKYVYIFEDKDASGTGELMAKAAEERLRGMGYYVLRLSPPIALANRKSVDWLDVLVELGESGFPLAAKSWRECN